VFEDDIGELDKSMRLVVVPVLGQFNAVGCSIREVYNAEAPKSGSQYSFFIDGDTTLGLDAGLDLFDKFVGVW
jgi:hypothetical protein